MQDGDRASELRLLTKDDLDAGLAAFRWSFYRALLVQALCIAGVFAAALAYL
jgi:hypothetical protein